MLLHFTSSSYCAQVCNFHLWNIWILCKHFTHNNSTKGRVWTSTELGNNISQTKFVCLFSFNVSPWESLLDFSWVLHNTNVHDFEKAKTIKKQLFCGYLVLCWLLFLKKIVSLIFYDVQIWTAVEMEKFLCS